MNSLAEHIGRNSFRLSLNTNSNSNANHSFLNRSLDILSSPISIAENEKLGIFEKDAIQQFGYTNGSSVQSNTISVEEFCAHVDKSGIKEVIEEAEFKSNKPRFQLLSTIKHGDMFTKSYIYIEPTILLESEFIPVEQKRDYAENAITIARFNKEIFYQIRARDCIIKAQNMYNKQLYYIPQIYTYGMVDLSQYDTVIDLFKEKRKIDHPIFTRNNIRMLYVTMEKINGFPIEPKFFIEPISAINNILIKCGIYHNDLTTLGNIIYDTDHYRLVILDFGEASYKKDDRRNPFHGGKRKSTKKYKRFIRSKRNKTTHKRK